MKNLWKNIFSAHSSPESLTEILSRVSIFSRLKPREFEAMKTFMHRRHYAGGELVFEAGEPASGMYLIRSGSVRLSAPGHNGADEELVRLGPGELFGEASLATPSTRLIRARTLESSELIALFHSDLLDILEKHPAMGARLLFGLSEVLSARLQSSTAELLRRQGAAPASRPEAAGSEST